MRVHQGSWVCLLSLTMLSAGCTVDRTFLDDLACNDTHGCPEGTTCIDGLCRAPGSTGEGDGGGGTGDAGALSDAGNTDDGGLPGDGGEIDGGGGDGGVSDDGGTDGGGSDGGCVATKEVCDGVDNDCNGIVDNVPGCLTTIAGEGPPGWRDAATGSQALFAYPRGLAYANGFLYVADSINHAIRKVDVSTGATTTIAGNGACGDADGPSAASRICRPNDVAVAANGDVYFADTDNHRIRKISNGVVSTVAGTFATGATDGAALSATFDQPSGIDVRPNGDVLIADYARHRIRRYIAATQMVTTVAGSTQGTAESTNWLAAQLDRPVDVVESSNGTLYVSDSGHNRIRKFDPVAGSSVLAGPTGTGGASGFVEAAGASARFNSPSQLALDEAAGVLFVADNWNNVVRAVPLNGTSATYKVAGGDLYGFRNGPTNTAGFQFLSGFARLSATDWAVADFNHELRKVSGSSYASATVSDLAGASPNDLVRDGPGRLARLDAPESLAVDATGNVYWVESKPNLLRRLTPAGNVETLIGDLATGASGHVDGALATARLDQPSAVAIGPDGSLYVAEEGARDVRRVDLGAGMISTFAGVPYTSGAADGALASATFNTPDDLVVTVNGAQDVLYVRDSVTLAIRKIVLPNGPVSTLVAGSAFSS